MRGHGLPAVNTYCEAIRDLAEAANRFLEAGCYDGRDEAVRIAIAIGKHLVPPEQLKSQQP